METKSDKIPFIVQPFLFLIFLLFLVSSNGLTYILRSYGKTMCPTNINMIILLNSYVIEMYNISISIVVRFKYFKIIFQEF